MAELKGEKVLSEISVEKKTKQIINNSKSTIF